MNQFQREMRDPVKRAEHFKNAIHRAVAEFTGTPCPYCGRIMSTREAKEQGACNDCGDKD
jgi:predicted RNA-binding Zn-ribbon protein involved in translation (DUF1610 family)